MKTEKLYEKDAYISRFETSVLSCEKCGEKYKTVLAATAFFPEGGGQPADTGTVSGGAVYDVQIENGEIYHYTENAFTPGEKVMGELDFGRRFNFMQNHTAEHIVCGLVHEKYGFDNIGFHLNETEVTFDFNGFFTPDGLREIEEEANRRVWRNLPVTAFYPSPDELESIPYRSKAGIEGEIRLVKIEDTDICACCAPHVKSTGEIGMIKLLGTEKQHGGTRVFMKSGKYALGDYQKKNADIRAICESLSAKTGDVREAVRSLEERLEAQRLAIKKLNAQMMDNRIAAFDKSKSAVIAENFDSKDLLTLADGLHKTYGGVRTALCENGGGAAFVMCGESERLEAEFQCLKINFTVKGGGRGDMRQGVIAAPIKKIKEYFGV